MRRILNFGAGFALLLSALLCAPSAQAEEDYATQSPQRLARTISWNAGRYSSDDVDIPDGLVIGKDVLTHIDRTGLSNLAVRWTDLPPKKNGSAGAAQNPCGGGRDEPICYFMPGDTENRRYEIPENKYIVMPVAYGIQYTGRRSDTYIQTYPDDPSPDSLPILGCRGAESDIAHWIDGLEYVTLKVDGKMLKDFGDFRVAFNTCRKKSLSGRKRGHSYAANGYWVILSPLSPGHHVIHANYRDSQYDCDGQSLSAYQIDVPAEQSGISGAARKADKDHMPDKGENKDKLILGRDVLVHIDGQSLEDLAVRWTDLMLKTDWMEVYNNRSGEDRGNACSGNPKDSIWFLMDAARDCKIPEGKYIVMPAAYNFQYAESKIEASCRLAIDKAARAMGNAEESYAPELVADGRILADSRHFRVSLNKCLISPENSAELPAAPYTVDGYWVIFSPLGKGYHEILSGYDTYRIYVQ